VALHPKLTNRNHADFLSEYYEQGVTPDEALELKAMSYPFSVRTAAKYVDIAVFQEIMAGRGTDRDGIYFDVTHVPKAELESRAPITYSTLLSAGLDLSLKPMEIGPAVRILTAAFD
jgi:succinate dehydrogenase/fumarate reductase flavoprotein subunit